MVDLDLKDFADEEGSKKKEKISLEKALNKTLQRIKETVGGNSTVLWTGNGYHIYQPVSGFILEEYETFYEFTRHLDKDLTSMFIQFAEEYFTDYTADRLHNPTVKSCLVRIPGSLNSKCIISKEQQDAEVKIIQRWDDKRPSIQPLIRHFRRWLIQKRIDDIEDLKKQEKKHAKFHMIVSQSQDQERTNTITKIKWIEKGILEYPLSDHRKYIICRSLLTGTGRFGLLDGPHKRKKNALIARFSAPSAEIAILLNPTSAVDVALSLYFKRERTHLKDILS